MITRKVYNKGTRPIIWARGKERKTLVIQAGKSADIPAHIASELLLKCHELVAQDAQEEKQEAPKKCKTKKVEK